MDAPGKEIGTNNNIKKEKIVHLSTLKNCPQCPSQKLSPVETLGQVLDTCERCHGLWFEAGELEAAWENAHSHLQPGRALLEKQHTAWGEPLPATNTPLNCPGCDSQMQRHHLSPKFQLELTRCPACQGIWVEESQRCATYHAPKVRAALTNINKPTNWRIFLFQLLTRLPVEFNMKPRIMPWVNWGLIATNILIFVMVIFYDDLYLYAGLVPANISQGEGLATFITYQFLHADFMHLFGNMFFLYLVGDNLEDVLGHAKYFLVYLVSGIAAGILEYIVCPGCVIPVVGASGSIAALFGMYLLWFRRARLTFMIILYQVKVAPWVFFLTWVLFQVIEMAQGADGVAYMAHMGGLAFGLLVGWLGYNWVLRQKPLLAHLNGPLVARK